jgi:pimeloyl-ACP methyl ester carboxylesterase
MAGFTLMPWVAAQIMATIFSEQFIKPAEQVAREVPNCQHVVLDDMGHMLAFENPQKLLNELLSFLGKAA